MGEALSAGRVFISYAHDDQKHVDRVRDFWSFLRSCGIDAELDLPAGSAVRTGRCGCCAESGAAGM